MYPLLTVLKVTPILSYLGVYTHKIEERTISDPRRLKSDIRNVNASIDSSVSHITYLQSN